jgi:hypothetical protein
MNSGSTGKTIGMDTIEKTALKEYLDTQKFGLLTAADEFTREHRDEKSAEYCLAQVAFIDQLLTEFVAGFKS